MRLLLNRLLRAPRHNRCLAASAIAIFIIVLNARVFTNSKNEDNGLPPVAQVDSASAVSAGVSAATSAPIKPEVKLEPRAYDPWPANRPLPCSPSPSNLFSESVQRSASNHGFLFVRLLKTGSASFLSAMIRMSQQIVKRHHPGASYTTCDMRVQHGWATDFDYSHRVIGKSFLYSLLRHPTDRAVSRFFYAQVSQKGVAPTDENFKNFLLWTHNNFYLQGLRLSKYDPSSQPHAEVVNEIIQNYDFIAITERMDESIVAMQMLLGLNTTDMIHFPVRFKGGYDHGSGPNRQCVKIQESFVTPAMHEFFESEQWRQRSDGDYLLYKAANQSLDMTIERLGRPVFETNLAHYRAAQVKAKASCQVSFPCNEVGTYNPDHQCVYEDSGCGQDCLDRVAGEIDHPSTASATATSGATSSNFYKPPSSESEESKSAPSKEEGGESASATKEGDEDEKGDEESEESTKPKESSTSHEAKSETTHSAPESASANKEGDEDEEGDEEGNESSKPKESPSSHEAKPEATHSTPKKAATSDEEEEDDETDEEESKPAPKPVKKMPETKKAPPTSDEEEEEEKPTKVSSATTTKTHTTAAKPVTKKSDKDEDDGDDDDEEDSKPKDSKPTTTTKKVDDSETDDY